MHGHSAVPPKAAAIRGGVRNAIAHDSAVKHVSGAAVYVDDIPEPAGTPALSSLKILPVDYDHIEKEATRIKRRFNEIFQ